MATTIEQLQEGMTALELAREEEKAQVDAYVAAQQLLLDEQKELVRQGGTEEQRADILLRMTTLLDGIKGIYEPAVIDPPVDPASRGRRG